MAYPTQITISAGKTVYEGDPGNDGGITSRQAQVSVTYQLERSDVDLLHVTAVKAREVDAAQEVACHHLWGDRAVREDQTEMDLTPRPTGDGDAPDNLDDPQSGQDDHDEDWPDEGDMDVEPPYYGGRGGYSEDGGGATSPPHQAAVPAEGHHACRTGPTDGAGNTGDGRGWPRMPRQEGPRMPQAEGTQPERVEPWVRKPQKLAIAAQARRLGLSDVALAEMIRERFGKESFAPRFAVDRLTKAEGDALLRALRALGQDERAPRPPHPLPA